MKNFLKRTAIASLIFGGYFLFYSQYDTSLTKKLSQKKGEFIAGVDFEAYRAKEPLDLTVPKKGDTLEGIKDKVIENWSYIQAYGITELMNNTFANAIGFTPYYGKLDSDAEEKKSGEYIEDSDEMLNDVLGYVRNGSTLIIRVRGDEKDYAQCPDRLQSL